MAGAYLTGLARVGTGCGLPDIRLHAVCQRRVPEPETSEQGGPQEWVKLWAEACTLVDSQMRTAYSMPAPGTRAIPSRDTPWPVQRGSKVCGCCTKRCSRRARLAVHTQMVASRCLRCSLGTAWWAHHLRLCVSWGQRARTHQLSLQSPNALGLICPHSTLC